MRQKDEAELFKRQARYVSPELIRKTPITIIGVGSVGSNLADICMKAGFADFTLCDFDIVEVHNLPNQRFTRFDIGAEKTRCVQNFLFRHSYQSLNIRSYKDLNMIESFNDGIVFSCLDSMESREELFAHMKKVKDWKLFVDVRVGLFKYSVILIKNKSEDLERYEASLNPEVKTTGRVCGMETIINGVIGASNHAVQKALQWLTGKELPSEVFSDVENDVMIQLKPEVQK
jgi:molybdopterin/thiamine biosynthesis adenylyltransferase